jgi:hypothetical protein
VAKTPEAGFDYHVQSLSKSFWIVQVIAEIAWRPWKRNSKFAEFGSKQVGSGSRKGQSPRDLKAGQI